MSQFDVEAAYLYNFAKFVRWPGSAPGRPLAICIAGQNPFGGVLPDLVRGEKIDDRPVTVRSIDRAAEAADCSLLFIGANQGRMAKGWIDAVAGRPVLTVSDSPDFLASGGIIQFVIAGDRVRFQVDLDAAMANHLALSSQLLKVAVKVVGRQGLDGGSR